MCCSSTNNRATAVGNQAGKCWPSLENSQQRHLEMPEVGLCGVDSWPPYRVPGLPLLGLLSGPAGSRLWERLRTLFPPPSRLLLPCMHHTAISLHH